jgi:hypothetical protein
LGCWAEWVGRSGVGALGSMAKILIRNVLIGFGVGLVLVTGLTFVAGEKPSQHVSPARH